MRNDMVIEFSLAVNASAVGLSRLCWAPKRTMRLCQGCSWSLREACLSAVAIFAIKTIVTEGVNKFGRKSKHLLGRDDWPPPEFYSCIPFIPPVSPPNTYVRKARNDVTDGLKESALRTGYCAVGRKAEWCVHYAASRSKHSSDHSIMHGARHRDRLDTSPSTDNIGKGHYRGLGE